jgi:hypothetical protein
MARPTRPKELERLAAFLATQRDEYRSDPSSAAVLTTPEPGAFDSGSEAGETGKPEAASANPKEAPELAAWIQVCRVLFNLDDFMTRD